MGKKVIINPKWCWCGLIGTRWSWGGGWWQVVVLDAVAAGGGVFHRERES
ncbi:hypothetical protein Hanom_Chr01g00039031 [Helianthus anomalus]